MSDVTTNERVSAYLDGELSADERLAFEQQLERDPELRRTLASFESIRSALRAPEPPVSEAFIAQTRARMKRGSQTSAPAHPRAFPWRGAGLAAAALLGGVLFVTQWDVISTQLQGSPNGTRSQNEAVGAPAPAAPPESLGKLFQDQTAPEDLTKQQAEAEPQGLSAAKTQARVDSVDAPPSRRRQASAKADDSVVAQERVNELQSKPTVAAPRLTEDADGGRSEFKSEASGAGARERADLDERESLPPPPAKRKVLESAAADSDRLRSAATEETAEAKARIEADDAGSAPSKLNDAADQRLADDEAGWLIGRVATATTLAEDRSQRPEISALRSLGYAQGALSAELLSVQIIRTRDELPDFAVQDSATRNWSEAQLATRSLLQLTLPRGFVCEARMQDTTLTLRRAALNSMLSTPGELGSRSLCLIPIAQDQIAPTEVIAETPEDE